MLSASRSAEEAHRRILDVLKREDIGSLFWYRPGADRSEFCCRSRIKPEIFEDGHAVFRFARSQTNEVFDERQNYYYPDPAADCTELPDPQRRKRVHGSTVESSFRLEGFTNYVKLGLALEQRFGKKWSDFKYSRLGVRLREGHKLFPGELENYCCRCRL